MAPPWSVCTKISWYLRPRQKPPHLPAILTDHSSQQGAAAFHDCRQSVPGTSLLHGASELLRFLCVSRLREQLVQRLHSVGIGRAAVQAESDTLLDQQMGSQ